MPRVFHYAHVVYLQMNDMGIGPLLFIGRIIPFYIPGYLGLAIFGHMVKILLGHYQWLLVN